MPGGGSAPPAASRPARQSDSLAKIDTRAVFLIGFAATVAQFLATHRHHDVLAYCACSELPLEATGCPAHGPF